MNTEYEQQPKSINFGMLGPGRFAMEPDDSTIQLDVFRQSETNTLFIDHRDITPSAYKTLNDKEKLEFRLMRRMILYIFTDPEDSKLQPKNLNDIFPLYNGNKPAIQKAFDRFVHYATSGYFHEDSLTHEEKHAHVQNAMTMANEIAAHFGDERYGMLKEFESSIGINNEVNVEDNAAKLFLMMLSPEASKKMRYEARRKIVLMDISLRQIAFMQQESQQTENIQTFLGFLNKHIWQGGSGQTVPIEILSTHSPIDYSCTDITFLQPIGGTYPKPFDTLWFHKTSNVADEKDGMNLRLTPLNRYFGTNARIWKDTQNILHWGISDYRIKRPIDEIMKMMRKDTKNTGGSNDKSGVKLILENKQSINKFLDVLQKHAKQEGFMFSVSDISDTIDNTDSFYSEKKGSDAKTELMKINIRFQGRNIQLLIHTPRSYMDYLYRDGTGWPYYEVNRVIDSGLLDLLYPKDIYGLDFQILKQELLKTRKREIQAESYALVPEARRRDAQLQKEYTISMKNQDVISLYTQMTNAGFAPKYIYCIGGNVLPVAKSLGEKFGAQLFIWQKEINEVRPAIPDGIRESDVLILDDIAETVKNAHAIKSEHPEVKIAFLIDRRTKEEIEKEKVHIDFVGHAESETSWILFPMMSSPWS